jgi:hypothetical protein
MKYTRSTKRKHAMKKKHAKQRSRKHRGGGLKIKQTGNPYGENTATRTLEEIVQMLKDSGKFQEWEKNGALFTYRVTPNSNTVYEKYIGIDGETIEGAGSGTTFRNDVLDNIPILGKVKEVSYKYKD